MLGEGVSKPRLFKGHQTTAENTIWEYEGGRHDGYQHEHDQLFKAIRNNIPYNETERSASAAMTGILGRMASESGKLITWDDALASNLELAPGLDQITMSSEAPVLPDDQGNYPVAKPGQTQVL